MTTERVDATGAGFHAALSDLGGDRLLAEHGIGGPPHLLEHLAELIADRTSPPDPVTHYLQEHVPGADCAVRYPCEVPAAIHGKVSFIMALMAQSVQVWSPDPPAIPEMAPAIQGAAR